MQPNLQTNGTEGDNLDQKGKKGNLWLLNRLVKIGAAEILFFESPASGDDDTHIMIAKTVEIFLSVIPEIYGYTQCLFVDRI